MSLDGVQVHLVDSIDTAMDFKRWLNERRSVLCFDVETEGLHFWRDRVRLIQFGDTQQGWAIPWHLWGGCAVEALSTYQGPLGAHHAKFDVKMIEHWSKVDGFPITFRSDRIDDSMVMAHILDPTQPVGLKNLAVRLIDRKAANAQRQLDEAMAGTWTWKTIPVTFQPYWAYGALDPVLTARLIEMLKPQVMSDAPKAYDLEMAVTWVIMAMERRGCHVDVDYTRERLQAFRDYCDQAAAWCVTNYGVKPGSNQDVIRRMQADGVEFTKRTESGKSLALDKEVLENVQHHPLAQVVLQRRRLERLASSYLENFLEYQLDGVIYPSFNALKSEDGHYGARTGRMSVSDPALQTLPRRSNASPAAITVRNCITASEGSTLLMCDFEQIEFRMLAHFAQDPGLAAAFGQGDFFTNLARQIFNDPTLRKDDPRRQTTKNAGYAKAYGAGYAKFAVTAGIPTDAGKAFMERLDVVYPGIRQFQQLVEQVAMQRLRDEGAAYVRSPLTGRKFVADPGKAYTLVNYLIQGTASEVLKLKNVELASTPVAEYMILDVHDEIISDVPDEFVEEAVPIVRRIMNDTQLFTIPLTAEVGRAFRWGEASK